MRRLLSILSLNLIILSPLFSQNNQKSNPIIYHDDAYTKVGYVVRDPLDMDWDSGMRSFHCLIKPYDNREIKELYVIINKKKIKELEEKRLLDSKKARTFKNDKNNYYIICNLEEKHHKEEQVVYIFSLFFLMAQYEEDTKINGLYIVSDKGELSIRKPIELTR
ncbi:MAG: hypothetical protein OHK0045_03660 [Raineya sp.]